MPGRPKRRALIARMANIAAEHGCSTAEEYWFGRVADGETVLALCRELGTSRQEWYAWVNNTPERSAAFYEARRLSSHALADQAVEIADTATPEGVQVAKERIAIRKWLAGTRNPTDYSDERPAGQPITLNIQELHLAALANAPASKLLEKAKLATFVPLPGAPKDEIIGSADVVDSTPRGDAP